ncbi:MAG: ABC transporter ATP-binding protein, partial [Thermoanaerobaculia bacterium]|nr:ABC transporter ATP-binding protein [Thermoanaerobaculia bacterium]
MISVERVSKSYKRDSLEIPVLRDINLKVDAGEFVALMGPSGSGKTTLLNLVAGLDKPTSGRITVGGQPISEQKENDLAPWRARHVGFIFQLYNLIPVLSAVENVELPLILTGLKRRERREHARAALGIVGLGDRLDHYPRQLSGGQEQRVAIARAIATDPLMLVADEPTGDLDAKSAEEILDLLDRLNTEFQKTIVMVTHDPRAAARAHRLVHLDKGSLSEAPADAIAALPARVPAVSAPVDEFGLSGSLEQRFLRQVMAAMSEYAEARSAAPPATEPASSPVPAFDGLSPTDIVELIDRIDGLFGPEPRPEAL